MVFACTAPPTRLAPYVGAGAARSTAWVVLSSTPVGTDVTDHDRLREANRPRQIVERFSVAPLTEGGGLVPPELQHCAFAQVGRRNADACWVKGTQSGATSKPVFERRSYPQGCAQEFSRHREARRGNNCFITQIHNSSVHRPVDNCEVVVETSGWNGSIRAAQRVIGD